MHLILIFLARQEEEARYVFRSAIHRFFEMSGSSDLSQNQNGYSITNPKSALLEYVALSSPFGTCGLLGCDVLGWRIDRGSTAAV